MNHERRTLKIRNPGKPGKEVLPCRLDTDELRPRWQRVAAIKQTRAGVEAELAAAKSRAKAAVDKLDEEERGLWKELDEEAVERKVDCEYLVDEEQGYMYVRRLDTQELVRRRELTKHERQAAKQGDLFAADAPTRTLDVHDDIPTVRRFDSDTADVGAEEEAAEAEGDAGGNGHDATEPPAPEPEPAQRRKKKGYDTRATEAH